MVSWLITEMATVCDNDVVGISESAHGRIKGILHSMYIL